MVTPFPGQVSVDSAGSVSPVTPLERLDDWDDFVAGLYPVPVEAGGKRREDYRDFDEPPRDMVREFYR